MIVYMFLMKRSFDKRPWPVVWENLELAEKEPYRVSEIRHVAVAEDRSEGDKP